MKNIIIFSLLLLGASALNEIVVKGNLFFDTVTGKQFWAKGIDYQPSNSLNQSYDVLADKATIDRDLPYLKQLGVNSIRVYQTDATLDHSYAMAQLEAAGIYVLLDVSSSKYSVKRENPEWNEDLFYWLRLKIDTFSKYNNILGYVAANEVSDQPNNTAASAFVKAAVRDVKAYVRSKGLKTPVGYAIADAGLIYENQEAYFACGDINVDPDFYGINIYRWCGNSSYTLSQYDQVTAAFTNWPIAVLLSEYGCIEVRPRFFTEVAAIYGPQMTDTFSGGLRKPPSIRSI